MGSSYHMEKEGLQRSLEYLQQHEMTIGVMVTDRHKQINKWLRENHPDISHFYDGCHVAKGTCIFNVVHNKHNYDKMVISIDRIEEEVRSFVKAKRLWHCWTVVEEPYKSLILVRCFNTRGRPGTHESQVVVSG